MLYNYGEENERQDSITVLEFLCQMILLYHAFQKIACIQKAMLKIILSLCDK